MRTIALLLALLVPLGTAPVSLRAATLFWDTNGTGSLGSGAATGTWGTDVFWTTDATGANVGSPTLTATTAQADDLFFSAGTNGTTGTVTISGTQVAHSITFDDPVIITLSGGTAIDLGSATAGSGLFFTGNAANVISTPIILNSAATAIAITNSTASLQTIGAITGDAAGLQTVTVGATSGGDITINGIIGNGGGGGTVGLTINSTGSGVTTLTAANTYTGATNINAGTLALSGAAGALASTVINLNGGNLTLSNATGQSAVNRVSDSAIITTNGGTITWNNPGNANTANWAENIGTLSLSTGQTNIVSTQVVSAPWTKTLTLGSGSLTHAAANTSAITFSGTSLGANAQNSIIITGQATSAVGEIIAPWATWGTTTLLQTDYASYNRTAGGAVNAFGVQNAAIAASAETTWSTAHAATSNFTMSAIDSGTISGGSGRNVNTLRSVNNSVTVTSGNANITLTGHTLAVNDVVTFSAGTMPTGLTAGTRYYVVSTAANTIQVSATKGGGAITPSSAGATVVASGAIQVSSGNNLGTYGILNGSATTLNILQDGGAGAVTLPTTTAGNLYVTAGSGAIAISAPITNNTGALTLVKNGALALTLSGTNGYSGGTTLNAGTLVLNNTSALGTGTLTINGGFVDSTLSGTTTLANNVDIRGDFTGGNSLPGTSGLKFTGTTTLNKSGSNAVISGTSTGARFFELAGVIQNGTTGFNGIVANANQYTYFSNPANTFTGAVTVTNASGLVAATIGNVNGGATSLGAPTTVADGTIVLGSGSTAGHLSIGGSANGQSMSTDRIIQLAGSTGGGTLTVGKPSSFAGTFFSNVTVTFNGALSGTTAGAKTLTLESQDGGAGIYAGVISDGVAGSTISIATSNVSAPLWTLSGANTFTGSTTINRGTLTISRFNSVNGGTPLFASSSLGAPTTVLNGTITFSAGTSATSAGITYTGPGETTDRNFALSMTALFTPTITNSGTGLLKFTGNFTNTTDSDHTLTLRGVGTTTEIAGAITQGGAGKIKIDKSDSGTWVLSNSANAYTGTTTLSNASAGSTLVFQGSGALPSASAIVMGTATSTNVFTLKLLNDTGGTINQGNNFTVVNNSSGARIFVGNTNTANGGTGSGTTTGSTIVLGNITSFGNSTPDFRNTTLNVTGADGYRLQIGSVNIALLDSGNFTYNATFNPTSAPLTITGGISQATGQIATTGSAILVLGGRAAGNVISGVISNAADHPSNGGGNANARALVVTKSGTSDWTLTGANSYTGATTISGGTLRGTQNSGTPFGTGAVTIGAGIMDIAPSGSGSAVALTGGTVAAGTLFTYNADATLSLARGSQTILTYTFGGTGATTARGTNGTLILSTSDIANFGTLGSKTERFIMNGTAPTQVNTLVSGVVIQDRTTSNAGDFAAYDGTDGFTRAAYTHTNSFTSPGTSTNTSVVNITTNTGSGSSRVAYALRVDNSTLTNTGTLTLGGSATGVAGLILNSGTISGGTSLTTPTSVATELTIYTSGTSIISTPILTATSQAGISVFGPGTLDFSGSAGNTFTGGLRINNSTVIATNNNQLGASTSSITLTGGTLQTSGTVALGGGVRAIILAAGQDQTGGTFNVTDGTTTFQNSSTSTKILSGSGSLTKTGAGTMVLSGNTTNTYTGGTFVNNGTLQLGASAMLADTGGVTVGGGIFDIQTFSDTVGAVTLTSGSIIGTSGVLTGTAYDVRSGTASANLAGTGATMTKTTSGTVTLSGTNTYTGATVVHAGTLLYANMASLYDNTPASWTAANINVKRGATFAVSVDSSESAGFDSGNLNTLLTNISVAGSTTAGLQAGAILGFDTSSAFLGTFTQGNIIANSTGTSGGAIGLTKLGTGALVLDKANTYTGGTTISAGTLDVTSFANGGSASGIGASGAGAANLVIDGGTLKYSGASAASTNRDFTIGTNGATINASGASSTDTVTFTSTTAPTLLGTDAARTLTLTGTNTGANSLAAPLGDNGSGKTTLVKNDVGTWVLTGTNTYTGNTTISAGNLQVGASGTGSTAAGSAVSVNGATAVLSGTGTVGGTTTVTEGQIKPGNTAGVSEGTLTFGGALTFNPTSAAVVAALTIQGTTTSNETGDKLSVTGALTLSSNSFFTVTQGASWTPTDGQTWDLLDWGSISLGSPGFSAGPNNRTGASDGVGSGNGNLDLPDISASGLVWDISNFTTNGSIAIVNLVPEPSRALLLLLGMALALFRRRRPALRSA